MFLTNVRVLGYTFRADGRYFILAERHKSKDTLGLYDTSESYKLSRVCWDYYLITIVHMADLALSVADRIIIFLVSVTNRQSPSRMGRAIRGGISSCITLRLCLTLL